MVLTARKELKDRAQFLSNSLSALGSPVQVRAQHLFCAERAGILHGARCSPNGILLHPENSFILIALELD
jgi:hypothetical protein